MKRSLIVTAVLAAVLASPAAAKGPTKVTITGPGLAHPIVLNGNPESDTSTRFGRLVETSGWFAEAFPQSPPQTSATRPAGRLGPRYVAVYLVPQGGPRPAMIRQELYPYAAAGAFSRMRPGQPLFGVGTSGGWYRGGIFLRRALVALGLPARLPS